VWYFVTSDTLSTQSHADHGHSVITNSLIYYFVALQGLCYVVSDDIDIDLYVTGPTFRDRCSIPVSDGVAYRT